MALWGFLQQNHSTFSENIFYLNTPCSCWSQSCGSVSIASLWTGGTSWLSSNMRRRVQQMWQSKLALHQLHKLDRFRKERSDDITFTLQNESQFWNLLRYIQSFIFNSCPSCDSWLWSLALSILAGNFDWAISSSQWDSTSAHSLVNSSFSRDAAIVRSSWSKRRSSSSCTRSRHWK